ncbi:MAG: GNAT family N-acetyltransferase [Promethearchaeota archaeon]
MIFKSIKPIALFERENRRYVEYFLGDAFGTAAMLIKSVYKSDFESYFFASEYGSDEIVGCISANYFSLHCIRIIIHGSLGIHEVFCNENLSEGEKYIFEYIRADRRAFFKDTFGRDPEPHYVLYSRDGVVDGGGLAIGDVGLGDGFMVKRFASIPVETIITFYGFSISRNTVAFFSGCTGLALFYGDKMIGAMYDNFSKLPVHLKEAMIAGVLIKRKFRNRGWCTRLLSLFIRDLLGQGKVVFGLYVNYNNVKAIKCYERAGFTKMSTVYRLVI